MLCKEGDGSFNFVSDAFPGAGRRADGCFMLGCLEKETVEPAGPAYATVDERDGSVDAGAERPSSMMQSLSLSSRSITTRGPARFILPVCGGILFLSVVRQQQATDEQAYQRGLLIDQELSLPEKRTDKSVCYPLCQ